LHAQKAVAAVWSAAAEKEEEVRVPVTVARQVAAALSRYGVEHIFGQSLPSELLLAAERQGIRQVFYRTENAGGAMADGYARVTRRVGVVAAQNGPAATLLVPPLAEALKASVPVIALVQEVPRADRDRNAFQEYDHEALFASCAKRIIRVDEPARVEDDVAAAFAAATSGRPGPVVLLFPRDVLGLDAVETPARGDGLGSFPLDRPRPARDAIERAAAALAFAERPVVIAGGGVHVSGASAALAALQEAASLPVATTTMGKGAVDEEHELSIGVVGSFMGVNSLTRSARPLIAGADVVLLVGTRTNENGTDAWRLLPRDATYLHLDLDAGEVGRNYDAVRLVGDARAGLEDLTERLRVLDSPRRRERRPAVVAEIAAARERDRLAARVVTASEQAPLRPELVVTTLAELLDPDAIMVADASYATIWAAAFMPSRRPGQRFLSPRGLAGLGWGLPMALGAQVAHPQRTVACLAGDGAFAHTWQELETAVREALGVTVILLNNGILGFQKHAELHTWGAHTSAVAFAPVDHVAIAAACGADAVRVETPATLRDTLAAALSSGAPTLVEVMTDPAAHPPITAWDDSEALKQQAEAVLHG
jgi:acetolactate synthase-1/2/3 large subunit